RPAWAQPGVTPGYYPRPPVSPYINLFRFGTNPAINNYGIVRPELELQRSLYNLRQEVGSLNSVFAQGQTGTELPPTGHTALFNYYGGYFGRPLTGASAARASSGSATSRYTVPPTRGRPPSVAPVAPPAGGR